MEFIEKTKIWPLVLITLVGIIFRIVQLGSQSFWTDEVYSVLFATNGIDYYLKNETGPPLFFGTLWIFLMVFGINEFVARIPAFLFGVLTIPLVYLFGKTILGRKEGLLAAFIISLSPWHIRWSQEARMYTLLIFFTVLALYFFYLAHNTNNFKYYLLSALFLILSEFTHFAGFLILPILVFWQIILRIFGKDEITPLKLKYLMIYISLCVLAIAPLVLFMQNYYLGSYIMTTTYKWGFLSVFSLSISLFTHEIGPVLCCSHS